MTATWEGKVLVLVGDAARDCEAGALIGHVRYSNEGSILHSDEKVAIKEEGLD